MKPVRSSNAVCIAGLIAFLLILFGASPAGAALTLVDNGQLVADGQGLYWLQNANLAASDTFGISTCTSSLTTGCVNPNGSMSYATAQTWVADMNAQNYLGHDNWQLPAEAQSDPGCSATGKQANGFAFNCAGGALGSLYYKGLGLTAPTTAVPPVANTITIPGTGLAFTNLQPSDYWTGSAESGSSNGFHTFSFAAGWSGANGGIISNPPANSANFFYALPMIPGCVTANPGANQMVCGGNAQPGCVTPTQQMVNQTVCDPSSGVTWLLNGNLAGTNAAGRFGLPLCSGLPGTDTACVNANGTMTEYAAQQWIMALDAADYLGTSDWTLPAFASADGCQYAACIGGTPAKDTAANDPLASLFYNLLGQSPAQTAIAPSTSASGPFSNLQPDFYWACPAGAATDPVALSACSPLAQCGPTGALSNNCPNVMDYSFNFLEGYASTDEAVSDLFVTAYFVPEPPGWAVLACGLAALASAARWRRRRWVTARVGRRARPAWDS